VTGSGVVLHVPHASRALTPEARRGIVLDDAELAAELDRMTDAQTDVIAARAADAAAVRPHLFINQLSRLVIDPERFPDEREEMLAVGMGAVYTHTSDGKRLRDADPDLIERHYRPYAEAFTDLVDDRLAATGRAVIIDVHSYPKDPLPYELHREGARPEICLGTDAFHTTPALLAAARRAFDGLSIAENTPFAGCYVPLKHYRRTPAVSALMIEIRRDTYQGKGLEGIVGGLTDLIDVL
jgi:N-formylglutamate deformylase